MYKVLRIPARLMANDFIIALLIFAICYKAIACARWFRPHSTLVVRSLASHSRHHFRHGSSTFQCRWKEAACRIDLQSSETGSCLLHTHVFTSKQTCVQTQQKYVNEDLQICMDKYIYIHIYIYIYIRPTHDLDITGSTNTWGIKYTRR